MKAILKKPDSVPEDIEVENELEPLQELVGGYIETVKLAADMIIICNEEGRLMHLPYNCTIGGIGFCGPIVMVGVSGEEFCDVPIDTERLHHIMSDLWEIRVPKKVGVKHAHRTDQN